MKICVMLADGFETVEALAVVDVLRRAGVEVTTCSIMEGLSVTSSHNITVQADTMFDEEECKGADAVFLPGGMPGTLNLKAHEGVLRVVSYFNENKKLIAAICAAPSILGALGLLQGRRATSHASVRDQLTGAMVVDEPVVVSDHIITSQGMGTAVLLGLELVKQLVGSDCAEQIKKAIHF